MKALISLVCIFCTSVALATEESDRLEKIRKIKSVEEKATQANNELETIAKIQMNTYEAAHTERVKIAIHAIHENLRTKKLTPFQKRQVESSLNTILEFAAYYAKHPGWREAQNKNVVNPLHAVDSSAWDVRFKYDLADLEKINRSFAPQNHAIPNEPEHSERSH